MVFRKVYQISIWRLKYGSRNALGCCVYSPGESSKWRWGPKRTELLSTSRLVNGESGHADVRFWRIGLYHVVYFSFF